MSKTIKKILYTTDLSDASWLAVDDALMLAKAFGAEMHVVSVVEEPGLLTNVGADQTLRQYFEEAIPRVQHLLEERLAEKMPGAKVHVVKAGHPAQHIINVAVHEKADLIMMATQGRTNLDEFVVGSTAEMVVRKSPVPVYTVRVRSE